MAHDSLLSNKEFEDGLIQNPLPPYPVSMKRMYIALCLGLAGLACAPASTVRPVEPTRSAPVGAGSWLFSMALDSQVEVPVLEESLLAATEMPLPPGDDGSLVLTLSPKGLFSRGKPVAAVREIQGVLHLLVDKGRQTPQGEIPGRSKPRPRPTPHSIDWRRKPIGATGKSTWSRTTGPRLPVPLPSALPGTFPDTVPRCWWGSPDGLARGMRLQGARPCPGAAPPKAPTEKNEWGWTDIPPP